MLYENVSAQVTSERIALKPTTGPKLMQATHAARPMVVQTARRGVSASGTWAHVRCQSFRTRRGFL